MSKRPWSEYRPARAMVACPQCGQPAGKQCRTHAGTRAKTGDHVARWRAWCAAGRPMPPPAAPRPAPDWRQPLQRSRAPGDFSKKQKNDVDAAARWLVAQQARRRSRRRSGP